ncbi:recombinase family protein [Bacillus amyloliquefaciens]|uniref:recombinase family protein n=1 Tax=Bacillus amyloliquefaciens TaxID=1390 RepID=UPI00209B1074|nr:recombinase family protein [Bacillus amyloliquefaciens]
MNLLELKSRIKHVAIYLRKSRNKEGEETEETLAKHRERLIEIVNKNNWSYEIFQEVESSMDENRPQYQRLKSKLSEGFFDGVLSVNLARVTRDDAETPRFMNLLRQEDILFITDSERIYDLEVQEDWQALKFTGFVNNWEYENIKAQLRKGKKDSAKMGRWSNGVPNYGLSYNRLDKTLEIDEEKAEAVRMAFEMVINNIGVDNIAIALNKLGYKTNRNCYFSGHAIYRIIRSEIYKGWIVSNRLKGRNLYDGKLRPKEQWIIRKNAAPQIVDEKTWLMANEALDRRKLLSPRGKQQKHALSNLIKCGLCGRTHTVSRKRDRNDALAVQACRKKDPLGNKCNNSGIKYDIMMEIIVEHIQEKRKEILVQLQQVNEEEQTDNLKSLKIKKLREQIKKNKKAQEILQLQLEEELISFKEFKDRRNQRIFELDDLEKELAQLSDTTKEDEIKSKKSFLDKLDNFLENWYLIEGADLNQELMSFLNKIIWVAPRNSKEPPKLVFDWRE